MSISILERCYIHEYQKDWDTRKKLEKALEKMPSGSIIPQRLELGVEYYPDKTDSKKLIIDIYPLKGNITDVNFPKGFSFFRTNLKEKPRTIRCSEDEEGHNYNIYLNPKT